MIVSIRNEADYQGDKIRHCQKSTSVHMFLQQLDLELTPSLRWLVLYLHDIWLQEIFQVGRIRHKEHHSGGSRRTYICRS